MAKKAAKTSSFSTEASSVGASSAPKKAAASRTQKHLKAQASGVVAAVEGFVSAITNTPSEAHAPVAAPPVAATPVAAPAAAAAPVTVPEVATPAVPAATPASASETVSNPKPVTHEEIAVLAYCYYLDRRPEDGTQADDWHRAEQALKSR